MKLRFGPHTVETSNDGKLLFPDSDISKQAVVEYYRDMAERMLPHLEDRCLTIRRFPDGIGADGFFQQHRPDHFPDYVGRRVLATADKEEQIEHIVAANPAALAYLADQAAIEFHGWLATASTPERPDRITFDLDPASDDFRTVVDCARLLREALGLANLVAYVMTTGSRGLHVISPLTGDICFDEIRDIAKAIAEATAAREPSRFTTEQRRNARGDRLYIDVGRNAYGQTGILPYSLRALEGAPVATPLDWDELGRSPLDARKYHLGNLRRRLAQKDDPFSGFLRHKRTPALSRRRLDSWVADTS